jgi:CRP-like cAMP-binding protein
MESIPVFSTIEKVIILKTVSIFVETPDEVLAEVAALLEEVEVSHDEMIFKKDDLGDSLYIIVSGKVRVHDGDRVLNYLEARDVFGEMALLDPQPRLASVTAVEETQLLRLGQESFFQLIDERGEVARGIIHVLAGRLRARVRDLAEANDNIERLKNNSST